MNHIRIIRDIDGNEYGTTRIGSRLWISTNLITSRFRNGESIPVIDQNEDWEKAGELGLPACCWYNNQSTGMSRFGLLYNWFAVNDPRGLAPEGWSIPEVADWNDLIQSQGGWNISGRKIKSKSAWSHLGNGNNSSGFSALPAGGRGALGSYLDQGDYANWWCRESASDREANFFSITFVDSAVKLQSDGFKASGLSVRCVRGL